MFHIILLLNKEKIQDKIAGFFGIQNAERAEEEARVAALDPEEFDAIGLEKNLFFTARKLIDLLLKTAVPIVSAHSDISPLKRAVAFGSSITLYAVQSYLNTKDSIIEQRILRHPLYNVLLLEDAEGDVQNYNRLAQISSFTYNALQCSGQFYRATC